jgi:hypothetical protein
MHDRSRMRWLLGLVAISLATAALGTGGANAAPDGAALDIRIESGLAAPKTPDAENAPASLPSGYAFWELQMNLCNSGVAPCYEDGKAVTEAYGIITSGAHDLVTLNEICEDDVRDELFPAIQELWPGDWTFWAFMPAGNRSTGSAYRCTNGERFGNGMLGRMFTTSENPYLGVYGQLYPESIQDGSSSEQRSWLCVNSDNNYWGCTTHLSSKGNTTTLNQCKHLMSTVIPSLWAAELRHPTVVGGDLNLRYGGSPNVQDCVPPSGWFRKGDGDVQHITVTNDFTFDFSRKTDMSYTDHDAWMVSVITP